VLAAAVTLLVLAEEGTATAVEEVEATSCEEDGPSPARLLLPPLPWPWPWLCPALAMGLMLAPLGLCSNSWDLAVRICFPCDSDADNASLRAEATTHTARNTYIHTPYTSQGQRQVCARKPSQLKYLPFTVKERLIIYSKPINARHICLLGSVWKQERCECQ
jgi:hypothetical protein